MWWSDLGQVRYRDVVFRLHRDVVALLREGSWDGGLLLFQEFQPVITCGSRGGRENLLLSREELSRRGLDLVEVDRGGNVTYHGPGQLVITPFLHLGNLGLGLHTYIHLLEEAALQTVQGYGIPARRHAEHTGVWSPRGKIAAVGVGVRRRVTFHGLSINVSPLAEHFSYLIPCGLEEESVASMSNFLERAPALPEVRDEFRKRFSRVFQVEPVYVSPARLEQWVGGAR